jgi:hypothetical protein
MVEMPNSPSTVRQGQASDGGNAVVDRVSESPNETIRDRLQNWGTTHPRSIEPITR